MKLGHRAEAVAESGDLADHVHAARPLLLGPQFDEIGRGLIRAETGAVIDALRRDPQTPDVQLLQIVTQLLGR